MEHEIVSLNLEDLDVQELEQRLELAIGMPITDAWVCNKNCDVKCDCHGYDPCGTDICGAECTSLCGAQCYTLCVADGCSIDGCKTL